MTALKDDVTAFVLAGGKSLRMGEDKAFLQFGEHTLLERALELAGVIGDVRIVGSAEKFARFGKVIEDVFPGRGPLGGIHAALRGTQTELNLILAVDLPFVESKFAKYLVANARQSGAMVTLARSEQRWQPLCAVYRRQFGGIAEKALQAGKNKVDALFAGLNLRVIEEQELAEKGFATSMFRNLNTREEWEKVRAEKHL
jgi:molybdenum cofactor guanylyltransferase